MNLFPLLCSKVQKFLYSRNPPPKGLIFIDSLIKKRPIIELGREVVLAAAHHKMMIIHEDAISGKDLKDNIPLLPPTIRRSFQRLLSAKATATCSQLLPFF
jgi:hypothetical protein